MRRRNRRGTGAFFALFVTPGGFHPRNAPAPHPLAVFLMLWLLFRLHVESGAAKWLLGDPTWRDLTAMATYYETAPLSTWVGWYAHQMPLWAHKLCSLYVYVVELGLPFLVYGPALVRGGVFVAMLGMQVSILLTGNYAFFNYLTIALSLFLLDDGQLGRLAAFIGWRLGTPRRRTRVPTRTALLAGAERPIVLSGSGNSANVVKALEMGHAKGMKTFAILPLGLMMKVLRAEYFAPL